MTKQQKDSKKKQLYSNASLSRVPDKQYLNTKRTSVFHKAFESKDKVEKFVPPIFQKSEQDIKALTELFATSFLTKHLDATQHKILANAMYKKHYRTGELIIRYGDMGHEYYVLSYGTCKVTVYVKGANPDDPQLETRINFVKTLKSYPE